MKRLLLILSVPALVGQAQAITWNFDREGDTQGWVSHVGPYAGLISLGTPLRSEVVGGTWRVFLPPYEKERRPAVELISPLLRRDSALFDQIRLRLRLVHSRPAVGSLYYLWTNAANEHTRGELLIPNPDSLASSIDLLAFSRNQQVTYTTDWQEMVIGGLQSEVFTVGKDKYKLVWEGELEDMRLDLCFYTTTLEAPFVPNPEAMPEAVEVAWIQLTGAEEQMQGELPPPTGASAISPGQLFAAPVFYPVDQSGIGGIIGENSARMGDFDGDGDSDLMSLWWTLREQGRVLLLNDGHGVLGHPAVENTR